MMTLVWGDNNVLEVESVEQLEHMLYRLISETAGGLPISVELRDSDASMCIMLGRNESHAEFYSSSQHPLVVVGKGPWDGPAGEEIIPCLFCGQYTEIKKEYCLPADQAREGLIEYFRTGQRPTNIEWS